MVITGTRLTLSLAIPIDELWLGLFSPSDACLTPSVKATLANCVVFSSAKTLIFKSFGHDALEHCPC